MDNTIQKYIYLNNYISESFFDISAGDINISTPSDSSARLYINSHKVILDTSSNETIEKCGTGTIRVFVDPNEADEFNFTISAGNIQYNVNYSPILYSDDKDVNNLLTCNNNYINNDTCSFMLLRTNPKLSGNIKLVVDSSNNMYLDTFKINKTLSNKKYRKVQISANSFYSNDIRNVFGDIPSGDLYDIPELGKNKTIKTDIKDQYIDTYYYGVRNNFDKLYAENFSMLAPLWINKTLPDFFVILRLDDIFDNHNISAKESFNNIIKNGKIIKYYDFRKNSELGNYLRNFQREIHDYMNSVNVTYNKMNFNTWTGISVQNGIITTVNESAYEINSTENQVEHDAYITLGYERNNLLNPYLINFEFMFNDNENVNDTLKLKRYVGLYIINNKIFSFYNINNQLFDENDELIESILKNNSNINLNNYIVNYSSYVNKYQFNRLLNTDLIDINNIPDNHILTSEVDTLILDDEYNNVMHININKPLKCGEHLRIINVENNELWEVIGVANNKIDDNNNKEKEINDYNKYYDVYNQATTNYIKIKDDTDAIVHSNIFVGYDKEYNMFIDDEILDNKRIIKEQILQIVKSFNDMSNKSFIISDYNDSTISFLSNKKLKFERILSDILYDEKNYSDDNTDNITFFNNLSLPLINLSLSDINDTNILLYHYMHLTSNRLAQLVDFCYLPKYNDFSGIVIANSYHDKIEKTTLIELIKTNNKQSLFTGIVDYKIKYYTDLKNDKINEYVYKTVKHPYNNNYIINIKSETNESDQSISFPDDKLILYNSTKFDFNIAGYLPIKDFNFNVLNTLDDNKYNVTYSDEKLLYKTNNSSSIMLLDKTKQYKIIAGKIKIGNKGEYSSGDIIPFRTEMIECLSPVIISEYFKNSEDSTISFTQQPILKDAFEEISFYDKYSLCVPYICKWELNGRDIFGNKIKMTNKIPNNDNSNVSYFLNMDKDDDIINNKFNGWPCYRYINNDNIENNFYIYNDINDIIKYENMNITLHDYIIYNKGNIVQLFRNDNNAITRFSTLYYNNSIDCLETIIFGKRINIISTNKLIDLSKYNNYNFTIICSPNANLTSNKRTEYIIDENNETFVCIYYTEKHNLTIANKDLYSVYNIYDSNKNVDTSSLTFKRFKQDFDFSKIIDNKHLPYYNKLSNNIIEDFTTESINDCSLFISTLNLFNEHNILLHNNYTYSLKIDSSMNIFNNLYGLNCKDTSIIVSYDKFNIKNNDYNINDSSVNKFIKNDHKSYEYIIGKNVSNYKSTFRFDDIKNSATDIYIKTDKLEIYNNGLMIEEIKPDVIKYNDINYYYHSYKCNPEFIDILYYDNDIDNISYLFNHDLKFSNILINDVKPIKQLYVNTVNSDKNYINDDIHSITKIDNYDITKCYWNNMKFGIKNVNNKSNIKIYQPGFSTSILKSMFMGGVGLIINDNILEITNWQKSIIKTSIMKSFDNSDDEVFKHVYKIDVRRSLFEFMINNINLMNNWSGVEKNAISMFIENVIFNIFDINNKNNIEVYRIYNINPSDHRKLLDYSYNDKNRYERVNNIKITSLDNNIYEIELPNDNYQYILKYIIKR